MKHFNFKPREGSCVIHTMSEVRIEETLDTVRSGASEADLAAIDSFLTRLHALEDGETLKLETGATYTRVQ